MSETRRSVVNEDGDGAAFDFPSKQARSLIVPTLHSLFSLVLLVVVRCAIQSVLLLDPTFSKALSPAITPIKPLVVLTLSDSDSELTSSSLCISSESRALDTFLRPAEVTVECPNFVGIQPVVSVRVPPVSQEVEQEREREREKKRAYYHLMNERHD